MKDNDTMKALKGNNGNIYELKEDFDKTDLILKYICKNVFLCS